MANTKHNPDSDGFRAGDAVRVTGIAVEMFGYCTGRYSEYGRFVENNLAYYYEVDFGGQIGIKSVDADSLERVTTIRDAGS